MIAERAGSIPHGPPVGSPVALTLGTSGPATKRLTSA
ncbi:hypothetical protein HOU47_gp68 [Arthrobacter phage Constance]|uniref:Uncharacterized protein n=1 Tax=Arthrobacter phage Constance TaxID=2419950 RepID=A0A3G2KEX2_9CAUD|nr:hypothetical protein HOU47_gp68 [Arthrobacter phage Constance]AYN57475.1 hypothetical protein PBI_CONSTANCE_68 [Arthrobacter phage Constance]